MQCQATKVYFGENMKEVDSKRCDEDKTREIEISPHVKGLLKGLRNGIVSDKDVYHLCEECFKAYDDGVNGKKPAYKVELDS